MSVFPTDIHPTFSQLLTQADKERLTRQHGKTVWLCGLSGSGKSTLANGLERRFYSEGFFTHLLDGDNLRTGLNKNLGFSDDDREENIRRVAEVSKLFVQAGLVTINAFITPKHVHQRLARQILGESLLTIYVKAPFEVCAKRDVKGLYAKAAAGGVAQFTGRDSSFEAPENPDLVIDTETQSIADSLDALYSFAVQHIRPE
ncbi:MAG TPA: adenylyl-sulfate kinase [Opitutaceae bacterium]|nr:adenylyl-sulfate kinase [Opitutaceae bacterium]